MRQVQCSLRVVEGRQVRERAKCNCDSGSSCWEGRRDPTEWAAASASATGALCTDAADTTSALR